MAKLHFGNIGNFIKYKFGNIERVYVYSSCIYVAKAQPSGFL